jgi:hypothetical protein
LPNNNNTWRNVQEKVRLAVCPRVFNKMQNTAGLISNTYDETAKESSKFGKAFTFLGRTEPN